MSTTIEQVANQYGLFLCVECGKCAAVCPMGEIFDDFSYEVSPRGVIEAVLIDGRAEILNAGEFWFCLTCDLCTNLCPAGVRFRDFVEAIRRMAIESGVTEHSLFCRNCGAYLWPGHTVEYLKQTLGEASEELLTLCPRCRQYDFGEKVKTLEPGSRKIYPQTAEAGEGQ
jgi:heterodisulfide reductase subunit C